LYTVVPKDVDADLNPTVSCRKYEENGIKESGDEESSKWFLQFLPELRQRLSRTIGIFLTEDQALTLMEICASQISILSFGRNNGVCYLFNDRDFENYEICINRSYLVDDIEKYYKLSYGNDFNLELSCSLITGFIQEMTSNQVDFDSFFRFFHAEAIIPFVSAFGLFHDDIKLSGSMDYEMLKFRKFKSSLISPFQGNIIFELYECNEVGDIKCVRTLLHEKTIVLPGCSGALCPLSEFTNILKRSINCNFDSKCHNTKHTSGGWNRE
jgi:hypothetical protein